MASPLFEGLRGRAAQLAADFRGLSARRSAAGRKNAPPALGGATPHTAARLTPAATEHRIASRQPSPFSASPVDGMPALRLLFPPRPEDDERRHPRGGRRHAGSGWSSMAPASSQLSAHASARRDGSGAGAAAVALGAQPAVVKIVSGAGGTGRVRALMTYVGTRESEPEAGKGQADRHDVPVRDERGQLVLGAAAREAVLAAWEESFDKRTLSRDVGRFEITVPAGTVAPERLREALVEAFAGRAFALAVEPRGSGQEAAHVAVILTGKGRWMSPDAKTLGRVEQTLAASLRDAGSALVAFRLVATGHALEGVQTQLRAVASRGRHGLTTEEGRAVDASPEAERALAKAMARDLHSRKSRDVLHIVCSARAGTDRTRFAAAVATMMGREFAGHRYLLGRHDDKGHVHVHAILLARNADGRKIDPKIADLARWREAMAQAAREHGIAMVATRRHELAAGRPFTRAHAALTDRGIASEAIRTRVDVKRAAARIVEEHPRRIDLARGVARNWAAASTLLAQVSGVVPEATVRAASATVASFRAHFRRAYEKDGSREGAKAVEPSSSQTALRDLVERIMATQTSTDLRRTIAQLQGTLADMRRAVPASAQKDFDRAQAKLLEVSEQRLQQAVQAERTAERVTRGDPAQAARFPQATAADGNTAQNQARERAAEEAVRRAAQQAVATAQAAQRDARVREDAAMAPAKPHDARAVDEAVQARRDRERAEAVERAARSDRAKVDRDQVTQARELSAKDPAQADPEALSASQKAAQRAAERRRDRGRDKEHDRDR